MTQLSAAEVLQSKYMPCVIYNLQLAPCHILSPLSAFAAWIVHNIHSLERALKGLMVWQTTTRLPRKFFIRLFKEQNL